MNGENIVVDTSGILAMYDESYPEHVQLTEIANAAAGLLVVSPLIVAESDYMLATRLGAAAARQFAEDISAGAYELAEWTQDYHAAALAIVSSFGDDDYIGMADASIVVIADRYRTTNVMTLDQRHFRKLKPLWGVSHFTLLPFDA
ncbi:PIN domain-containing protein [Nocardia cyriacigeorgica]|uniref:Ribonuclease VapC n=1 Tax=Nocardia cyriacigeorgica TaxID=135487 RepID=A0A5R8NK40_9NOCA|nr:PIN domain-containing protein [Nocardia cyriacigeorgica]TLF76050.1 PIN domain-containing protein [Nocardia cyriacigeorgica]